MYAILHPRTLHASVFEGKNTELSVLYKPEERKLESGHHLQASSPPRSGKTLPSSNTAIGADCGRAHILESSDLFESNAPEYDKLQKQIQSAAAS